jgi:Xaa-Pro aminopeptidase
LKQLLGIDPETINDHVSVPLIRAVVAQRSVKSPEEIEQIEAALDTAYEMQTLAMRMAKPGMLEGEVAGAMEGIALSKGVRLAFPTIFSIHGETLHNHFYGNAMREGDLVVNDSGAESPLRYASDITRTIPIGGRFSRKQKEIYSIVLDTQTRAIEAVKPGVEFRSVHRLACRSIVSGLRDLGLMKGDVEEAVEADAHALFFPCGVGHMLGLDVHDMEALGEDYVGYSETINRSSVFGWKSLRLAKAVEPGFVVTVEPGIYFIAELIDRWRSENRCSEFINYDVVEKYKGFGGIRIEDDLLVVEGGHDLLSRRIPKTVDEVETLLRKSVRSSAFRRVFEKPH